MRGKRYFVIEVARLVLVYFLTNRRINRVLPRLTAFNHIKTSLTTDKQELTNSLGIIMALVTS